MFEPRNILTHRTLRTSVAEDSADTSITVNSGGGGAPARPELRPQTRHVTTSTSTTHSTPGAVTTGTRTVTETHRQVNWGGVAKGVAMVAGAIFVAVVAYYVVPALLTSAGIIGPNGLLTGVVEAVSPAVTGVVDTVTPIVSSVASTVGDGLLYAAHFMERVAVNAFGALGGTSAVSAVTATASEATTSAVSTATGALAAGGAFALSAPLAMKTFLTTPLTELSTSTHTVPVVTGVEGGGVAHTTTSTHTAGDQAHSANSQLADLPELPDDLLNEQTAASLKTATKVAHHAAHEAEGNHSANAPEHADAPENSHSRDAIRNGARRSEAWAERVGQRQHAAVAPRSSQFADQLTQDRAQLDAALKTASV